MSRTIDEKVVEMRFDNSNFESNVKQSMSTLDKLKESLKFSESAKSFENIDKAASKVSFSGLTKGIDEVQAKFSKLDMITNTVLSRMTNAAIDFGTKIITAIPSQIKSGGLTRALNIEQAKFQIEGLGRTWDEVSDDINYAVEGTAYGLDEAAKAASQLLASNVQVGDSMKAALRGVSGVAAMTNSSYSEIAHIFTSVAGQGKVMTIQLRELENRGLNAAAKLAESMGVSEAAVRDMVTKGQIDFETFSKAMDDAFGEHAKDANKTFSGALANMKAALSRIGADFAGPTLVNLRDLFNQLRVNFNDVRQALQPVVKIFTILSTKIFKELIAGLKRFSDYFNSINGKADILEGMTALAMGLYERLSAVGKAFKEVFMPDDKQALVKAGRSFAEFANKIRPTESELEALTYIFKGLFTVIKGVGNAIKFTLRLLALLGPKLTPIVTIGGTIILLVAVISKLTSKFRIVGQVLVGLLPILKAVSIAALVLAGAFGAFIGIRALIQNFDAVKEFFTNIGKSIKDWYQNLESSHPVLYKVLTTLKLLGQSIIGVFAKIGEFFKNLPSLFGDYTWTDVFSKINEGLTNFVERLKNVNIIETAKGWIHNFGEALRKAGEKISNNPFFQGFGNLIKRIGEFISGIKKVKEETVEVVEVVDEFRAAAGGGIEANQATIGAAGNTVETFGDKIAKFKEKINAGKIAAIAFSAAFTVLIASIAFAAAKIGGGIGKLTSSAAGLIDSFKKKLFGGLSAPKLTTLEQFAVLIGTLAASLVALTLVDQDKLMTSVKIIGIFTAALALLSIILKKINGGGAGTDALGIAGIGISIAAIAGALLILDKIQNVDTIYKKIGAVALAMGALVGALFIINKAGKGSLRSAIVIVALGVATRGIANLCNMINDISGDPKEIATKVLGLVAVMLGFGLLAAGIGQIRLSSAIGLFLIITILNRLMPEIEAIFSKLKVSEATFRQVNDLLREYKDNIIMLAAVAAGIVVALGFAGKGIGKIGTGFMFLAAGIIIMGFALQKISDIINSTDPDVLKKATAMLIGMMAFITILTLICGIFAKSKIGKNAVKLGIMIMMISVAMLIMVGAIALLGNIDGTALAKGIGAFVALGIIIALLIDASSATKKLKIGPIIALLASLVIMSTMLVILSFIPWQDLIAPIIGIGVIMAGIALIFSQISKVKTTDKQGMKAMLFFLAMLGEIIAGIILISRLTTDWRNTAAAAAGISACILSLAIAMRIVAKTKISKATAENFALAAKSLIWVGAALAMSSFSNMGNIISTAASISGMIFALIGALYLLKRNKITAKNVEIFAAAVKALLPVGAALAISAFASPGSIIAAAGGIAIVLAALIGSLVALDKWGGDNVEENAKTLLKATLAILPVAGALVALSYFAKDLKAGPVIALMAIFAEVAIALGVLTKKTDSTDLSKSVKSLWIGMASLLPVAGVLIALSIFAKDLKAGPVIALMAIFAEVAVTLGILTKKTGKADMGKRANALLVGTLALIPIAVSLVALSRYADQINFGQVVALMAGLAEVAIILGILTKLTKAGDIVATSAALLIASLSMIPVAISLVALSKYGANLDFDSVMYLLGGLLEVGLLLGILTVVTQGLDVVVTAAALVIATASLIEVAYAFKLLAEVANSVDINAINQILTEWFAAIAIITIIIGALSMIPGLGQALDIGLVAIAGAMAIMAFAVVELAAAFTIASIGFKLFVPTLEQFIELLPKLQEAMSWDMLGAMIQLALGLAAIGAAGIVAGIGGIGLWAFGAALTSTFLPAMQQLCTLSTEDIALIAQKIEELVAAMQPLQGITLTLLGASIAFLIFGAGLLIAAIGIQKGAEGLQMLLPVLMALTMIDMTTIGEAISQLSSGLINLGLAGIVLGLGAIGLILGSTGINMLLQALTDNAVGEGIGAKLSELAQGLQSIGLAGIILDIGGMGLMMAGVAFQILGPALQTFVGLDLANLSTNIGILASNSLKLAEAGIVLGTGAIGMQTMASALMSFSMGLMAVNNMLNNLSTLIVKILDVNNLFDVAAIVEEYEYIGEWIIRSVAQGIQNASQEAVTAAQTAGEAIYDALKTTTGVGSFSEKIGYIGEWIAKSLGIGIDKEGGSAILSAENLGDTIKGILADILSQAGIDLSNLKGMLGIAENTARKIHDKSVFVQKDVDVTGKVVQTAKEKNEDYGQSTKDLNSIWSKYSGITDEVTEATENLTKQMGDLSDATSGAGGAAKSASSDFDDLKNTIEGQMDIFSEFNMKTEMTGEQMLNNMRSQIQGVSTWAANMQELALRGMSPALLKKLGDLGPQGYEKVNAFMQMTHEQLAEANGLFAQSLVLPGFAASQVSSSYGYAGAMAGEGFVDGLGGYQQGLDAASPYFQGVVEAPAEVLDEHSPSRVMEDMGFNASLGFHNGWNKGNVGLLQAIESTMTRIVDTIKSYTNQGGPFTLIGQSIQQAILNGITTAQTMVSTGMEGMGSSMGMEVSPLLTAFLGSFTYENGSLFLDQFIMGLKDSINMAFGFDGTTSTWSYELFMMLLQGILDCIDENYEDFEEDLDETFFTPIKEKFEEYVGYDAGYDIGKSTAEGLIDGMMDMLEDVKEAAAELGKAVAEATSGSLEINSPSHVFQRIGHSINEGLALGIKDSTGMTTNSLLSLTDGMSQRMNTVISSIASMIDSNIDMQPTISPVLDTTNISNGARTISAMFGNVNRNASITASGYANMLSSNKLQADLTKSSESRLQRDYTQAIIDAVNASANGDTNVNVVLDGDAGKVFNLVRTENDRFTSNTRYNPLAHHAY